MLQCRNAAMVPMRYCESAASLEHITKRASDFEARASWTHEAMSRYSKARVCRISGGSESSAETVVGVGPANVASRKRMS